MLRAYVKRVSAHGFQPGMAHPRLTRIMIPHQHFHTSAPNHSLRQIGRSLWSTRLVRYPVYGAGSIVFSIIAILGGLMVYDSMTYKHMPSSDEIKPRFSSMQRGGPDNLPVLGPAASDDDAPDENVALGSDGKPRRKQRLVIVGGGWAAVGLLSKLEPDVYDVVLVSPNNYFLFTPLLPAVAVGTVGFRSITESLRKLLSYCGGSYMQGAAVKVHAAENLDMATLEKTQNAAGLLEVEVISTQWDGDLQYKTDENHGELVYVPYDKLVIAVGSVTNSRVAGVEHCTFLKTIRDAYVLRKKLIENLEVAALPTTSEEERRRLLSFVICGGGPTGVEVAAEIVDLLSEDVSSVFPAYLAKYASIHLIQSRNHILNTYSESISEFAENVFRKDNIDLIVNSYVKEVKDDSVVYTIKNAMTGEVEERSIPSGLTIWSAGIRMADFTRIFAESLPRQHNKHALVVDTHLRVLGAPRGTVYALGDASTIDNDMIGFLDKHFSTYDRDNDGELTVAEFKYLLNRIEHRFPITSHQLRHMEKLFEKYDHNHDMRISIDELHTLLHDLSKSLTSFPPTAQVASQEGKYLGRKLNYYGKLYNENRLPEPREGDALAAFFDVEDEIYKPFRFHSLGSIAYLGNAAAFDLPLPGPFHTFFGGLAVMYAWRSVYLSELVSVRTRTLVLFDFIKRGLFGRDITWS